MFKKPDAIVKCIKHIQNKLRIITWKYSNYILKNYNNRHTIERERLKAKIDTRTEITAELPFTNLFCFFFCTWSFFLLHCIKGRKPHTIFSTFPQPKPNGLPKRRKWQVYPNSWKCVLYIGYCCSSGSFSSNFNLYWYCFFRVKQTVHQKKLNSNAFKMFYIISSTFFPVSLGYCVRESVDSHFK